MRRILEPGGGFPTAMLMKGLAVDAAYVVGAWALFAWMLRQVRDRGLLSRFGE
jgi:hypothetical protein